MATGLAANFTTTTTSPFKPAPAVPSGTITTTPTLLRLRLRGHLGWAGATAAYKVTVEHAGATRTVEVGPEETILSRALEEGIDVPHDCKLGVCMTCPARLVAGDVDQNEGMLSEDVVGQGYALLCVAYPRSDCHVRTIPEDELLALQLATAND